MVTCTCFLCDVTMEVRGAIEAITFLCQHNRHSTYVKGQLIEPVELPTP